MIPVMARARLGRWDEVLQSPKPAETWKYAVVLDRFAKGLAQIHNNDLKAAKKSLDELDEAMEDSLLSVRLMPFNSPLQSCRIASDILAGQIIPQPDAWQPRFLNVAICSKQLPLVSSAVRQVGVGIRGLKRT